MKNALAVFFAFDSSKGRDISLDPQTKAKIYRNSRVLNEDADRNFEKVSMPPNTDPKSWFIYFYTIGLNYPGKYNKYCCVILV